MDINDLMSILDTAKQKNNNAQQKDKGKTKSEGKVTSTDSGTGVKLASSDNDTSKSVIVEPMTYTFKPARGAKIGINDKWAEFEEKIKQQKREEMRKKAEEIKRRLEEEERKEKEEKERLKQEKREAMIKEKKKIWEQQFGKKPAQESKKTPEDKTKHKKHHEHGDSKHSKSLSEDRKRTHSISDDDDVVSVKVKPEPEKPKKPKIKKFNRPMPPPVNFADILKMAEQKQHEPIPVKKPLQKNKMEGRPLSQYEKDRLERIKTKEYKDWVKYGIGKPQSETKHNSSDDDSAESDVENSKKNSASISLMSSRSAFNSGRDRSPAVSKVDHKSIISKKEHSSVISQKLPLPGNDRISGQSKPSEKSNHSSEKGKSVYKVPKLSDSEKGKSVYKVPKLSDTSGQTKGSHSASSSRSHTNPEGALKNEISYPKEHRLSSGLNPSKPSTKPKMSASDSKLTKHSSHSKSDDSGYKSSSNHKLSDNKMVSKAMGVSDVKVSSKKQSSSSNHVKSSSGHHRVDSKSSTPDSAGSHHIRTSSKHGQCMSNIARSYSEQGHAASSHSHSGINHAKSSSQHGQSASSHAKISSNHSQENKVASQFNKTKHSNSVDSRGSKSFTGDRKRTHSISDDERGDQDPSYKRKAEDRHTSNSVKLSSNSTHQKMLNKSASSKYSTSSDKKLSRPSNSEPQHSQKKMASKSPSKSEHKLSNNKVLSKSTIHDKHPQNNHGKPVVKSAERHHSTTQADSRLVSKDKLSHSNKTVRNTEKEVNRLKVGGQGDKVRSGHHDNNRKDLHKVQVKQTHDSKHGYSSTDGRDSERLKSKGDSNSRNSYDSVHEAVLICGPSSPEEDKPRKHPAPKNSAPKTTSSKNEAPAATNPWDRIYGEIKRKAPKPVMKKKNVIASDSEEENMADFIDDDDEIEDPADLDYSKYIKQIFGYDRNRYRDDDGDVDNMESSYSALMKEEARSARLGLLEDLEDMKREEDEFKARMMKKKIRRI